MWYVVYVHGNGGKEKIIAKFLGMAQAIYSKEYKRGCEVVGECGGLCFVMFCDHEPVEADYLKR